jgi:endonuclease YncB( thermonuclease family)
MPEPHWLLVIFAVWMCLRAARRAVRAAAAAVIAVGVLVSCGVTDKVRTGASDASSGRYGTVMSWTDGDTARVRVAGTATKIRLLGVSAPETHGRTECGGPQATAYMRRAAPVDTSVRVTTNAASGDVQDRFGRTLAYLNTAGGRDVGEALIRAGHASVYAFQGRRFSRRARYEQAEASARAGRRGSWPMCGRPAPRR